jgi:hypothetical protein
VQILLSQQEREHLAAVAHGSGESVSTFLRRLIRAARVPKPIATP